MSELSPTPFTPTTRAKFNRTNYAAPFDKFWFMNVETIETAKPIHSLLEIWKNLSQKQIDIWSMDEDDPDVAELSKYMIHRMSVASSFGSVASAVDQFSSCSSLSSLDEEDTCSLESCFDQILSLDNKQKAFRILHCVVRAIHIKIHLSDLEEESVAFLKPRKLMLLTRNDSSQSLSGLDEDNKLRSKLVLQSYMAYLENEYERNGRDLEATFRSFEQFVNECRLRLVSTVHPNETERSTNLLHYTRILDLYIRWRREWVSIQRISLDSPEYRIRREQLNQLRRKIKAEIESVWQSDQLRLKPITVTAEARRLMDRYRIIFESFPVHQKFCKQLVMEAYWLFNAAVISQSDSNWINTFSSLWLSITKATRADRVSTIKKTFRQLGMEHLLPTRPKLSKSVIHFSTWKGGDRDGNPFVTAAFTNQTFVEQKLFVLQYYTQLVRSMVDMITPSLNNSRASAELLESMKMDAKKFPFIDTVKFQEPYRAKLRYVLEKLTNSLHRTSEIADRTGEATKPLLSLTLTGPSGYSSSEELMEDINVMYDSLIKNDGKSQARSQMQDLKILVDTFGLHMCSVDFRQVSTQNLATVIEYANLIGHPYGAKLKSENESEKRRMLMDLILSPDLEFDPSLLSQMTRLSRDTLQSLLIYADAVNTDRNMVGKFIISMCQDVSDILVVMLLLKLSGMVTLAQTDSGPEIVCHQDITGLYETIEDLKNAPRILKELLEIPLILQYITNYRNRTVTVMLGYSDSVRDGSALCSDAQVSRACIELGKLEQTLNSSIQSESDRLRFVFYRGRGDSLPRGFGGNIKRSIASQSYTTLSEDHTEQNRYLRRYATASSALDHYHDIYSAHVSSVVNQRLKVSPFDSHPLHQTVFELCGHLSNYKWKELISEEGHGDLYFSILAKYTILPVLPGCQFASRPVCRSGVSYNIDNIRAIPFAMDLAQMREFTVAYYGCGTAFDQASIIFEGGNLVTTLYCLVGMIQAESPLPKVLVQLLQHVGVNSVNNTTAVRSSLMEIQPMGEFQLRGDTIKNVLTILSTFYSSIDSLIEDFARITLFLRERQITFVQLLREMFQEYAPFRYSIENKIHSLMIRNKRIVDEYTQDATEEERNLLSETEREATQTRQWVFRIDTSEKSRQKIAKRNYDSVDLEVIHKIQSSMLKRYRELQATTSDDNAQSSRLKTKELKNLSLYLQMTILAISEALGFGG